MSRSSRLSSPPGLEEFFLAVGVAVGSRATPPPKPSKAEQEAFQENGEALAPRCRTELLKP
jgi:hypothetical protein